MYIQLHVYISTDPENNVILPVDLTFVVNVEYMYVSIFTSHRQHRIVCKKGEKRSISLEDKAIKLFLLHRQSDICYCFYTRTCLWQCLKDQYSPGEYLMALIWDFPTWTVIMCIPFFAFSTKNLPATEPTATQRPRLSTASAVVGFCKNKKIMTIDLHEYKYVHQVPLLPSFLLTQKSASNLIFYLNTTLVFRTM